MSRSSLGIRAAVVVAFFAMGAVPAQAAQPVEGAWHYSGGIIEVEPTGPGAFRGTVVRATRFGSCLHPVGERAWLLTGSADSYAGTHQWFADPNCNPQPGGPATWTVREEGEKFLLDFCTAPPGSESATGPGSTCSVLDRAKPPVRTQPRVCGGGACLEAPKELVELGCLPRKAFTYRFPFTLRKADRRKMRVKLARFALDWKPNGLDRRAPFEARVDGSRITPAEHLLRADVRLSVKGTRRTVHRRLAYRFKGCE